MHDTCPGCETPGLAFAHHDHGVCADTVMLRAESALAAAGQRLTPVRRRTLEILLESHRALGAYDVLERLAAEGFGRQPPVAYRALEFLEDHGLAHRIRRLNAFTACMHPAEDHAPCFLICRTCHSVSETAGASVAASVRAVAGGFQVERLTVEALGLCPACQGAADAA